MPLLLLRTTDETNSMVCCVKSAGSVSALRLILVTNASESSIKYKYYIFDRVSKNTYSIHKDAPRTWGVFTFIAMLAKK